jgi:hypothetical protein
MSMRSWKRSTGTMPSSSTNATAGTAEPGEKRVFLIGRIDAPRDRELGSGEIVGLPSRRDRIFAAQN